MEDFFLLNPVHRVHSEQVLEGFGHRPAGCTAGQANGKNHVPGTYLRNAHMEITEITFERQPESTVARLPTVMENN